MVLHGRYEGRWNAYRAAARAGLSRLFPACVLVVLVLIGAAGFPSRSAHVTQVSAVSHQHQNANTPKNNDASFFLLVAQNHDAIEAIAAVGGVGAAIWLAVVTGFLYGATKELSDSTEDLARGAIDQVHELQKARVLAERQQDLSFQQFGLAEKAHALEHEKFFEEHRPKITIRGVVIKRERGFTFEPDVPIEGGLVIENEGGCDAHIQEATYCFFLTQHGLPLISPLETGPVRPLIATELLPFVLQGHGSFAVPLEWSRLGLRATMIPEGVERLYLIGTIRFHGGKYSMTHDNMRERWMGFCREYKRPEISGGDGTFEPVKNPNYEYGG